MCLPISGQDIDIVSATLIVLLFYRSTMLINALARCSEETLSLLGGKWRFPRREVRLCSEETPGAQNGTKKGSFKAAQGVDKLCLLLTEEMYAVSVL